MVELAHNSLSLRSVFKWDFFVWSAQWPCLHKQGINRDINTKQEKNPVCYCMPLEFGGVLSMLGVKFLQRKRRCSCFQDRQVNVVK